MPRPLKGETFKLKTRGPDGKPLWAYRLGSGRDREQTGGFRTQGEAREALDKARDAILSRRSGTARAGLRDVTFADLADLYLSEQTGAGARTVENYRAWIASARKSSADGGFGDLRAIDLSPLDVATWRKRQPERSAHFYHKAVSQALAWGKDVARVPGLVENVAALVSNPRPKKGEVAFFETWDEVEAMDVELPEWIRGLAVAVSGTGLMPEEWIALRARDVALRFGTLTVARAYSEGRLADYGKTEGRRRRIPLRARVVEALSPRVEGLDPDALVFPGLRGGFLPLRSFRRNFWNPAVEAAGFDARRTPYAMRHTYAAFSLAAGVNIYTLARRMGTSVAMIDRTYGHLAPDADDFERDLLDRFDAREAAAKADEA